MALVRQDSFFLFLPPVFHFWLPLVSPILFVPVLEEPVIDYAITACEQSNYPPALFFFLSFLTPRNCNKTVQVPETETHVTGQNC